MTQKVLGLDLGTNSIGSSVRNLDLSDDLKGQLEFFSSDIFRSSVNKESNGREYSLAAQRSAHSRSRRLNEARRRKLWATLDLLIKYGFCPMNPESLIRWRTYDKQKGFFREYLVDDKGRIQRANALRRKVIKSFRKNTQKEYKNLIFLLVED